MLTEGVGGQGSEIDSTGHLYNLRQGQFFFSAGRVAHVSSVAGDGWFAYATEDGARWSTKGGGDDYRHPARVGMRLGPQRG